MTDLDRLIEAVEAGKYDRASGTPRYYDFGHDTEGILPGSMMDRMDILGKGKEHAISTLRAVRMKGDGG
jgi:hypothetical protein